MSPTLLKHPLAEIDLHPASTRPTPLRAGPLALEYEAGDLRYIAIGSREVLRRVYVAVRDRNWGTIPPRRYGERVEVRDDRFRISYHAEHIQGGIDFRWLAEILGEADGTIRFRMEGRAHSTFLRNRIGLCILHPIRECAGKDCSVELANGTWIASRFPREIAPEVPFGELKAIAHEVETGLRAELRMEGDLFEMEDQRNWLDASFKTYCTPLCLPFPVEIREGTRVEQTVTLTLRGRTTRARRRSSHVALKLSSDLIRPLPSIGVARACHGEPLSLREIGRLRLLKLAHLRSEFRPKLDEIGDQLRAAALEAVALEVPLEAALFLSEDAEAELARLVEALVSTRPEICRWLVFHDNELSTSERSIAMARRALARYHSASSIVSGTNANFAELNRGRPPIRLLDGVCFAAHPQEHAFDDRSLVETLAMFEEACESARRFCGQLPLSITPITLRRRVNPYATAPIPGLDPGELPPRVDPRQMSLFGAGWTIGSLKYASFSGAASLTYYESTGWLGLMETERGSPLPDRFPSIPGAVFPVYHALADVGEFAGGHMARSSSSDPLRIEGLVLRNRGAARVLIANLTDQPQKVAAVGIGESVRLKILDEVSVRHAMTDPDDYRAEPGEALLARGGRLEIQLARFAVARIDWAFT
jgi:D-apionolactonase